MTVGEREERLREANRNPFYICPNKHRWETDDAEVPLVNIKCPNCGKTAIRHYKAVPDPHWHVQPLRRIEADVPALASSSSPPDREQAERKADELAIAGAKEWYSPKEWERLSDEQKGEDAGAAALVVEVVIRSLYGPPPRGET